MFTRHTKTGSDLLITHSESQWKNSTISLIYHTKPNRQIGSLVSDRDEKINSFLMPNCSDECFCVWWVRRFIIVLRVSRGADEGFPAARESVGFSDLCSTTLFRWRRVRHERELAPLYSLCADAVMLGERKRLIISDEKEEKKKKKKNNPRKMHLSWAARASLSPPWWMTTLVLSVCVCLSQRCKVTRDRRQQKKALSPN